jgi:hypothetical protein
MTLISSGVGKRPFSTDLYMLKNFISMISPSACASNEGTAKSTDLRN